LHRATGMADGLPECIALNCRLHDCSLVRLADHTHGTRSRSMRLAPYDVAMPSGPASVEPPDPPLTDGRVRLRVLREDDLPRLVEEGSDETTARWVNVPVPYGEAEAREELHTMTAGWRDPAFPLALVIADAATDEYCGLVLLMREHPHDIMEMA